MTEPTIESLLREGRSFPPPASFREHALVNDPGIYARAAADPEAFWADIARELLWMRPWDKVLEWAPPHAKWFLGGKINAAENCVHRHARGPRRTKRAIIWEGEPDGEVRTLTYAELSREVSKAANALRALGIKKGDRVAIYLPMVPEIAISMLACAHIGAIHSVVFAGFSAQALASRVQDAGARLVITSDGSFRRGNLLKLKETVDDAVKECPSVERVIVVARAKNDVTMQSARDVWWHDIVPNQSADSPPEPMDAEDPLYTLYTSGTTGKPKGVLHTTAGYLVGTYATTKMIFDLREDDIYFCTADCGWVTGHSYIVYGPLANGATVLMYEGAPDWPDKARFWSIIERHRATILYTAPTAIRSFMKWGAEWPQRHDLSTLRLLGTVGEPINPEAWIWYHENIGGARCPIVDTWWQTETGMIMITTLPGVDAARPGFAGRPFPGVDADIVDEQGKSVADAAGAGGYLVLRKPWPAMFRTLWQDAERYQQEYWSRWPGVYFPKDGAKRDDVTGYYMILGRVDDVIKVSGHRIGTMEVESALVSHPAVAEAAVVGRKDEMKGEAIVAYVIPRTGMEVTEAALREHVARTLGAIARPDRVILTPDLPKTRSGKIMRRLLRDIAEGRAIGDATTLADPSVVAMLQARLKP